MGRVPLPRSLLYPAGNSPPAPEGYRTQRESDASKCEARELVTGTGEDVVKSGSLRNPRGQKPRTQNLLICMEGAWEPWLPCSPLSGQVLPGSVGLAQGPTEAQQKPGLPLRPTSHAEAQGPQCHFLMGWCPNLCSSCSGTKPAGNGENWWGAQGGMSDGAGRV